MHYPSIWLIGACLALTTGEGLCLDAAKLPPAPEVFTKLQQSVAAAGKTAEPSLALVKIEGDSAAPMQAPKGMALKPSTPAYAFGIVLTTKGHVLIQGQIKQDQERRITVLIGEKEYVARSVKTDEALNMTILKLDSADTFVPLDISAGADLAIGEWAVVLRPTDEDSIFRN